MKSAIIEAAEFIQREADELFDEYAYVEDDGTHWADRAYEEDHQRLTSLAQRLSAEAASRAAPPAVNESLTTGWQPIETAPKDGSWVLLSGGRQSDPTWYDQGDVTWPSAAVCRWCDEFESWKMGVVWDGDLRSNYDDPAHWMPLPAPPAIEGSPSVEKSSVIRAPQRGGR